MTKTFIDLYYLMHPLTEKPLLQRFRIYSVGRFLVRLAANIVLPVHYRLTAGKRYCVSPDSDFVVTLTSFPLRTGKLWLTIETLLRQTYRPREICLWLSREQYPEGKASLPRRLLKQQERGLHIFFVPNDYRSHKKYYTILQQQQTAVVMVDDDIFYTPDLLERLHDEHLKHPRDVIAPYTHRIRYDEKGEVMPYSQWQFHYTGGDDLFFGSGGGTCFPVGSLYKDVCHIEHALQTCPVADDIWLNAQVRLAGTHIRRLPAPKPYRFINIMRRKNINLCDENIEIGRRNDDQLEHLIALYQTLEGRNPFAPCVE